MRVPAASKVSILLVLGAAAAAQAERGGDLVQLLTLEDPRYAELETPLALRTSPEAMARLVVFRHGVPVLDRGLRTEKSYASAKADTDAIEETGFVEDAKLSADGGTAVVVSTRYRRTVGKGDEGGESEFLEAATELTWIEPEHPDGRWTRAIEPGRWAGQLVPLSLGQGVAVSTFEEIDGPADFRIYDDGGREIFRRRADEASVIDIVAARHGGFLAVDSVFPQRPGVPARGILVLDLLHGTRWTYTWSYGEPGEPLEWLLQETGVLEVKTPTTITRHDRNGKVLSVIRRR